MRDTHNQLQAKFLSKPENKAEYDKLERELINLWRITDE